MCPENEVSNETGMCLCGPCQRPEVQALIIINEICLKFWRLAYRMQQLLLRLE